MKQITGLHAIEEWLRTPSQKATLFVSRKSSRNRELTERARSRGIPVRTVSDEELALVSGGAAHKGIVLRIEGESSRSAAPRVVEDYALLEEGSVVVLLDEITDPRNYGAILRSCDLFSVSMVIRPKNRSVRETGVVTQTSSGADAYVPVSEVVNLSREIDKLKEAGFWVYGAEMSGESAWDTDLGGKVALVLGSEGKGLRQNIAEHCDALISIPTSGHLDSLNVSVAAGVLLYEIRRQRK